MIDTIKWTERISCDNAGCLAYVDELFRRELERECGLLGLEETARASAAQKGWMCLDGRDLCPNHSFGP